MTNPHLRPALTPEQLQPPSGPVTRPYLIVPSDSLDLPAGTRVVYVGVAGNVAFQLLDGTTVVLSLAVGWHPIVPRRILATGTTASGLIGGV